NDFKPENLKAFKLFYFLSCVVIAFGIESQEIMDVQSQLLFIGSSADMNRNYGGRTRKGSRTGFDSSTPEGVPLPSYRYGRRLGVYT
ncbi:hypothetical protein ACSSDV_003253, partial [Acinetobacter baumannii]